MGAEIKNGRLAMLAITGFCFQEALLHPSVIEQTPIFFKPIWETLNSQVPGYIIPEDVVQETAAAAASSVDTVTSATTEAISVAPPVDTLSTSSVDTVVGVTTEASGVTAQSIIATPSTDTISGAAESAIDVSTVKPTSVGTPDFSADVDSKLAALDSKLNALDSKFSALGVKP